MRIKALGIVVMGIAILSMAKTASADITVGSGLGCNTGLINTYWPNYVSATCPPLNLYIYHPTGPFSGTYNHLTGVIKSSYWVCKNYQTRHHAHVNGSFGSGVVNTSAYINNIRPASAGGGGPRPIEWWDAQHTYIGHTGGQLVPFTPGNCWPF